MEALPATPAYDERRDSPRVPLRIWVRDLAEGGSFEERDGELALGGLFWSGRHPPSGRRVDVRFRLPGHPKEMRAHGEIIQLSPQPGGTVGFHVRFVDLDLSTELALARFLDEPKRRH